MLLINENINEHFKDCGRTHVTKKCFRFCKKLINDVRASLNPLFMGVQVEFIERKA